jgi:hypothetical protein
VTESLHESISKVISEAESAAAEARGYQTVERWRTQLLTRISLAAGGAEFIPGVHGLGIVAELPYLFYLMGRGSIGVGALLGAEIDAESDLRRSSRCGAAPSRRARSPRPRAARWP